jgi:hypothetical protein
MNIENIPNSELSRMIDEWIKGGAEQENAKEAVN